MSIFLNFQGGQKYRCRGILFKFAVDEAGLYGGDENAQKSAGHDLNGLLQYYGCNLGFHFPVGTLYHHHHFISNYLLLALTEKSTTAKFQLRKMSVQDVEIIFLEISLQYHKK